MTWGSTASPIMAGAPTPTRLGPMGGASSVGGI